MRIIDIISLEQIGIDGNKERNLINLSLNDQRFEDDGFICFCM